MHAVGARKEKNARIPERLIWSIYNIRGKHRKGGDFTTKLISIAQWKQLKNRRRFEAISVEYS